jgi:hypothetical protein
MVWSMSETQRLVQNEKVSKHEPPGTRSILSLSLSLSVVKSYRKSMSFDGEDDDVLARLPRIREQR